MYFSLPQYLLKYLISFLFLPIYTLEHIFYLLFLFFVHFNIYYSRMHNVSMIFNCNCCSRGTTTHFGFKFNQPLPRRVQWALNCMFNNFNLIKIRNLLPLIFHNSRIRLFSFEICLKLSRSSMGFISSLCVSKLISLMIS